jgi:ornithine carbamoyltransferase
MSQTSGKRDFISLLDFSPEELGELLARSRALKAIQLEGRLHQPLRGRTLAMIFRQNSTRTRVGFEAGMSQLGGHAIVLNASDTQLSRGEPIEDTARVLSGMVDAVVIRSRDHAEVCRFAAAAEVPVINAMTARFHPCQLLADIQTYEELRGSIRGRQVAFVGDGYNMCNSYINAARQWGFQLKIACPEGYRPDPALLAGSNEATLVETAREAATGADLVVTDVWSSMGHETEADRRRAVFAPFQVNEQLLDHAKPDVVFLHCLPAHRGEEVSDTVLHDRRSAVWQESDNRLHTQKALLEFLIPRTC